MDDGIDHPTIEFRGDDFFDHVERDLLFRAEMMLQLAFGGSGCFQNLVYAGRVVTVVMK